MQPNYPVRKSIFMIKYHKLIILTAFMALSAPTALASMSYKDYAAALKAADQAVKEKKTRLQNTSGALSSALLRQLFGRYYEVDDSWDVAAVQIDNPMARMTQDEDQLKSPAGRVGIFHYRVAQVKTGPRPEVVIEVTQREAQGIALVDPKVERLTLRMNDRLLQSEKVYSFQGIENPVAVSPQGLRSRITSLELFPLDVPEVATGSPKRLSALPEFPVELQKVLTGMGLRSDLGVDLAKSKWFDVDDFLAAL